jgi:hypothetical protein
MAEAFPVSGNIEPDNFPFLLADLHRQGATGSLKVEGPSYPKALYFRGGRILFGSSNDPKDQLGTILIESGKITQEQLDEVNTKVGPGNPLAKVLAESGFVNQRELSEAARVKVERILSDVISYNSGSFEFEDGVLPKGAVDLKLSTEKLLLAAVSRLADRGFVLRHLGSLAVVLAPTSEMGEKMAELRPEAAELPERLDGHRTLKEAAALTRLDEFEAAKVACALLFLGLATKVEPRAGAAADELDLGQTARMAFNEEVPSGAVTAAPATPTEPDSAFFIPEDESKGAEIDITMADTPAPAFAEGETPPLGVIAAPLHPAPPPVKPAPEPDPTAAFSFAQPESTPAGPPVISFGAPEDATMPRALEPPPQTQALDRPVFPPPPPAPPPPRTVEPLTPAMPDFSPAWSAPSEPMAFEEPAPRETVAPARPSKEDLAALDALLNPSASMRSASVPATRTRPLEGSGRHEPAPRATRAPSGHSASATNPVLARPNRRRSAFPMVPVAAGLGLLAVGGASAWYFLNRPQQASTRPAARASKAPAPSVPPVPPSSTLAPLPSDAMAPTPGVSALPTPVPSVAATPPPASQSTVPASRPPAPPATTLPAAAAKAPSGGGLPAARQLLERRDFVGAARGFEANLRSSPEVLFSVQLLVACSDETVDKAVARTGSPDLFILPVNYKGRSCYRLCWGLYDSEARANAATSAVPAYFREGGARPRVMPTSGLLN